MFMKNVEYIQIDSNKSEIQVFDDEQGTKLCYYRIDKRSKMIEFYPNDSNYFIDVIYLDGFDKLPNEFSEKGYMLGQVQYYLNTMFKDKKVNKFIISFDNKRGYRKVSNGYNITIPYDEFSKYKKEMVSINSESKSKKRKATQCFLNSVFPTKFKITDDTISSKKRKFISGLDINIIPTLTKDELQLLEKFVFQLLEGKYVDISKKMKLITTYKDNVQLLAVDEAIKKFESTLAKDASESEWGKIIKQYLFLIESKYVRVIPELNLQLASWRKVDFGYVDNQGYLDIFEIKKPSTNILSKQQDRGNYYWHTEMVKAITQAEKYLYAAERKAPLLKEDIKREKGIDVEIIRPQAFLIAGTSEQFVNDEMKNDFKLLRDSVKNIEIILYDELLDRFKNLKTRAYNSTE